MAEITGKLKPVAEVAVTENAAEAPAKKTRKPRDPNKPRLGYFLGHVDDNGQIVVDKFSRNASQLLVAMDAFTKEGRKVQLVTFTAD